MRTSLAYLSVSFVCLAVLPCSSGPWWQAEPAPEIVARAPMDPETLASEWDVTGPVTVEVDDILGRTVLVHNSQRFHSITTRDPVSGPCELSACIRITETRYRNRGATLLFGIRGPDILDCDSSLRAMSRPKLGRYALQLAPRLGSNASWAYQNRSSARPWPDAVFIRERFPDISPVWEEDFRREIETVRDSIVPLVDSWMEIRIVHDSRSVRLYTDDLLIAERSGIPLPEGRMGLRLLGNVRIASLKLRRLPTEPSAPFYPVDLAGLCNATLDNGLVQSEGYPDGEAVRIENIPFHFPARKGEEDHIDIGQSLFHYRKHETGVMARQTWPAPWDLDSGRLMLTVPNRTYRRLWIVACSDGAPHSIPRLTVRFFRPHAGFEIDAAIDLPGDEDTTSPGAVRLPMPDVKGAPVLWLIPIELDGNRIASEFREASVLSMELTKAVHDWRAFPDPMSYGRFQGGPPSSVRILAMTLEEAPLRVLASGSRTGNTFVAPETPTWEVALENLHDQPRDVRVLLTVTDPYGTETQHAPRQVSLEPGTVCTVHVPIEPAVFGLHRVRTEVRLVGDETPITVNGTFVQLPPDTRRATTANSRWGLPNFAGAHLTNPNMEESFYLHRAAGSRMTLYSKSRYHERRHQWGLFPRPIHLFRGAEKWAYEEPYDPAAYEEFSETIGRRVADLVEEHPDIQYVTLFAETKISLLYAAGILPQYLGEAPHELDADEERELRARWITAEAATKGIRKHAPDVQIVFGWCGSLFAVPFIQRGYPKEDMDAIGLDMPQFERMPEMPIRSVTPSRLWMLKDHLERLGYDDVPLIHTESYFPTSHRLALGHDRAADHIVRTAVLSMALGSDRFLGCFSLYDCADYWGTQHYGCIGIVGRRPMYNPKPAFPAYATMTRMLDVETFDAAVPTGSLSAHCVRFTGNGYVHALWTIRGTRPAVVNLPGADAVTVVDMHGNETTTVPTNDAVTLTLSPTPLWLRSTVPATSVELGPAAYTNRPGPHTVLLDPMNTPWTSSPAPYPRYAENHWDMLRLPGPMHSESVPSQSRDSNVWRTELQDPDVERKLAAWYGVFHPDKPIPLPGKPRALGVWVNGKSNWGRIIYEVRDANGEIFQSVGSRDSWNCDDIHSWSAFNFDGWRYVEFPLPGSLPYDNYREKDSVWWNHDQDGIVDYPLELTAVILEMRTHIVYVDDCVPVPDRSVDLHELIAVYDDEESMTEAPLKRQKALAGILSKTRGLTPDLPNPIAELNVETAPPAPTIVNVQPPAVQYDGTRVVVSLTPVENATEYRVYVAAYEDGRGATVMESGPDPELLVKRLRPDVPLYLFATWLDEEKLESRPTAARRILLKDEFPMK